MSDLIDIRSVWNNNAIEKSNFTRSYTPKFDPFEYNLIAYYKAKNSTFDGSNRVSNLMDISGNGRHLTQAVDANKPIYTTGEQNGKPGLIFNGSTQRMQTAAFGPIAQPYTIFLVWKVNTLTASSQWALSGVSTFSPYLIWHPLALGGVAAKNIRISAGTELAYQKNAPFSYIITSAEFNGTSGDVYENGVLKATGNVNTGVLTGITMGCFYAFSNFFNGGICECVYVGGTLTADDYANWHAYLKASYAL